MDDCGSALGGKDVHIVPHHFTSILYSGANRCIRLSKFLDAIIYVSIQLSSISEFLIAEFLKKEKKKKKDKKTTRRYTISGVPRETCFVFHELIPSPPRDIGCENFA